MFSFERPVTTNNMKKIKDKSYLRQFLPNKTKINQITKFK